MSNKLLSDDVRTRVYNYAVQLIDLYKAGALGGEVMPEDANPGLDHATKENYLYFTLPMALNYQRNSYKLWEAASMSYADSNIKDIFNPEQVIGMTIYELREKLTKYRIALQPNKHTEIWMKICSTLFYDFNGDVRNLFAKNGNSVATIKEYIQKNKKSFPYLSGPKILNYWLYVMLQYTDANFNDRENITVAPDTHVIQASIKLGLIKPNEAEKANAREHISNLWSEVFEGTEHCPIDIHTPLWLWSRNGFVVQIGEEDEFIQTRMQFF